MDLFDSGERCHLSLGGKAVRHVETKSLVFFKVLMSAMVWKSTSSFGSRQINWKFSGKLSKIFSQSWAIPAFRA
jgi:hypothetical protein